MKELGRCEAGGACSRLRRVGPFVFIAGTTALEPSGRLHAPDDAYAQSLYILRRFERLLEEAGAAIPVDGRSVTFDIAPYEIVTLLVTPS